MTGFGQSNPPAGAPLVAVEGTYREMGFELGERTRDAIAANLEIYLRRFRDDLGLSEADVNRWGAVFAGVAKDYDSAIADMITGLSEGSGLPVEHIAALNARTELLYGSGYRDVGCTSVAVLGRRTANGHTLLAQNWDWNVEQGPYTFLVATRDTEGFAVLTLAEAGMLAKSGLNSSGMGVCANMLMSDRDAGGIGVPFHYLLRGVLQSDRMGRATRKVLNVPRVSSGNLLIADSGGEAIDLEVAPGTFGHLLPQDGVVAHGNHFASDISVVDRNVQRSALTLLRPGRVTYRLEDAVASRTVEVADVVAALRDHYSYPDSVCVHVDPDDSPNEATSTAYSVVMDLDAQELYIASYPVCENPYAKWALADVFQPDATAEVFSFGADPGGGTAL